MAATQTSMLPLTTIFTPPITCLQSTRTLNGSLYLGPTETSNCLPPGWKPNSWYSPGLCPSGYALATRVPYSHGNLTASQGICCPSGFKAPSITETALSCSSYLDNFNYSATGIDASPVSIRWHEYIDPNTSLSLKEPKATARLAPVFVGVSLLVLLAFFAFGMTKFILPKFHNAPGAKQSLLDDSSDEVSRRDRTDRHLWSITRDSWFYETIAIALSILFLSGIGLVLWSYDKQMTPEFSYGLTLNTAISLLAATTKALLVFIVGECIGQLRWVRLKESSHPMSQIQEYDNASRGPLGAVSLIGKDRGRTWVTIGALITILVLAVDPFVQQILTYPVRETVIKTSDTRIRQSRAVNMDVVDNAALTSAANSAIWTDTSGLDVVCPTGNCSWPLFQSIELCSRCEDITSKSSIVGCVPTSLNNNTTELYQSFSCNVSVPHGRWSSIAVSLVSKRATETGFQDPVSPLWKFDSSFALMIPLRFTWSVQDSLDVLPIQMSPPPTGGLFPKDSFLGLTDPIYVLAHAKLGLPSEQDRSPATSMSPPTEGMYLRNVTQCALAICSRTYEVSVSSGQTSTKVKKEDFGEIFIPYKSNQSEDPLSACWKPNSPIKEFMDTGAEAHSVPHDSFNGSAPSEFGICWQPGPTFETLPDLRAGEYAVHYGEPSSLDSWEWSYSQGALGFNSDSLFWTDTVGFDTIFHRVAFSLSKFLRDNSDWTVSGDMTMSKSFVEVRWPWLIFPIALVVLTILLLGATMSIANTRRVSLWKTSVLPLLLNGPGHEVGTVDEASSLSEMDRVAETIHLKLEESSTKRRQVLRRQSS